MENKLLYNIDIIDCSALNIIHPKFMYKQHTIKKSIQSYSEKIAFLYNLLSSLCWIDVWVFFRFSDIPIPILLNRVFVYLTVFSLPLKKQSRFFLGIYISNMCTYCIDFSTELIVWTNELNKCVFVFQCHMSGIWKYKYVLYGIPKLIKTSADLNDIATKI